MLNSSTLGISLISGLVGALLAVAFQSYIGHTLDTLATKRDVLRRFAWQSLCLDGEFWSHDPA